MLFKKKIIILKQLIFPKCPKLNEVDKSSLERLRNPVQKLQDLFKLSTFLELC